jgi:hypothetical protein
MAVDDAVSSRLMRWAAAAEVDWDAVFTEQLPRIYNVVVRDRVMPETA